MVTSVVAAVVVMVAGAESPPLPPPSLVERLWAILTYQGSLTDVAINYALFAATAAVAAAVFVHPHGPLRRPPLAAAAAADADANAAASSVVAESDSSPCRRRPRLFGVGRSSSGSSATRPLLSGPSPSATPLPLGAAVGFLAAATAFLWAFQLLLCLYVTECYGISIVWSALWGMCAFCWAGAVAAAAGSSSSSSSSSSLSSRWLSGGWTGSRAGDALAVLATIGCLAAWAYYAAVEDALTTVAHAAAVVLGATIMVAGGWRRRLFPGRPAPPPS
ncbi:hypothetical protein HK405_015069, partial [Cladochytrium tenue]